MLITSLTASSQDAKFEYFSYKGNDARFQQEYKKGSQYLNPILAGFYPDPAFCRVGDKYYLVNSSFSFFPGVPLFESDDLVNWKQIGHVLDRESQLPLKGQGVSGGIFAPDIKYNPKNKTMYMITTNVGMGNFYVKTQDPHKGWSDPIVLRQIDGIDPSFFFDTDGKAYIVHNGPVEGGEDYGGQRSIRILEFDVKGDSIVTKGTPNGRGWWEIVRGGTHVQEKPIWIEGPHLYKIDKYYYLMCAEGGTGDWHSEVIFRAPIKSDITKATSWEECPNNPILTQRHLYDYVQGGTTPLPYDAVTSTGHADMLQASDGSWWAIFLGCRAYEGPFYNTGRDTYMLPVSWKDGWPCILEAGKKVPTIVDKPGLKGGGDQLTGNFDYTDKFDSPSLDTRWMFLRNPSRFYETGNGLTIHPLPVNISQRESLSAIFCRQQHTNFIAETTLDFSPATGNDLAGLALLQNEDFNFVFGKTILNGKPAVVLTRSERVQVVIGSAYIDNAKPLKLKIEGDGRYYSFYYSTDGSWQPLSCGVDAINLSTSRSGGFIGVCIGLYATSANEYKNPRQR